ncbi:MAG: CocE/NonD family hydrolase, partial [Opitutaceae bacterium]
MRSNRLILLLVAITLEIAARSHAQDQYPIILEKNVAMKTRDGVTLRADIYRPRSAGKFPVLLNRTPYNKRGDYSYLDSVVSTAAKGYVCIIQDTRGRFASDGDWAPFKYESPDGYDTVEWAAALPYANGRVGMFGGSYMGATQMLAAIATPPHLVCIFPVATASNYYGHWVYHSGPFELLFSQFWCSLQSIHEVERRVAKAIFSPEHWDRKRPLADYPLIEPGTAVGLPSYNYYSEWLAHPT